MQTRATTRMGSVPNAKQLAVLVEDATRKAAVKSKLPWGFLRLREYGQRGADKASKRRPEQLDLPPKEHVLFYVSYINQAIKEGIDAMQKSGERPPLSDESIKYALRAFSVEEWERFIAEFGYEEASRLGFYLDAHKDELEKSLGKRNAGLIEAYARKRRIVLALSSPKERWTSVTDPLWAEVLRQDARARSLKAVGNPELIDERVPEAFVDLAAEVGAKVFTELKAYLEREMLPDLLGELERERKYGRKQREMASDRAVADTLNKTLKKPPGAQITPYQINKWRERREEKPFSEFGGSFVDYLHYISDPDAYERLLKRRKRSEGRDAR